MIGIYKIIHPNNSTLYPLNTRKKTLGKPSKLFGIITMEIFLEVGL